MLQAVASSLLHYHPPLIAFSADSDVVCHRQPNSDLPTVRLGGTTGTGRKWRICSAGSPIRFHPLCCSDDVMLFEQERIGVTEATLMCRRQTEGA